MMSWESQLVLHTFIGTIYMQESQAGTREKDKEAFRMFIFAIIRQLKFQYVIVAKDSKKLVEGRDEKLFKCLK